MTRLVIVRLVALIIIAPTTVSCVAKPDPVAEYRSDMAACVDTPPPTDAEIRTMATIELHKWHKLSLRASDQVASATALKYGGRPTPEIPPCTKALAWKVLDFERELKYR